MALARNARTWRWAYFECLRENMIAVGKLSCCALALLGSAAATAHARQSVPSPPTQIIDLDQRAVRVWIAGMESREPGKPVVVFESGATSSLDAWVGVLPQVARMAPAVAYDRAGLGRSEWDNQTPTPRHVVQRLRRVLHQVGAAPPYILVGHSWGGSLVRYFAGYHPDEVAGVVYIDPGPIVTQSPADEIAPFDSVGAGRAGYEAFWSSYAALMERGSVAAQAEFNVYRSLMQREFADRDLMPAPAVPVVVLVAAKPPPLLANLSFDAQAHFEVDLRHRVRKLQEWALTSPRGTLVLSNHSNHAIPREDPALVIWAVQRVLLAAAETR